MAAHFLILFIVVFLTTSRISAEGWKGSDSCVESSAGVSDIDVSSKNIVGEIPYGLPPNATHINMACNQYLCQIVPLSLSTMKKLRHLNLSHNFLFGPIGNVLVGFDNLEEMDLSYNNFTGDLSSSFGSLSNLSRL